MQASASITMVTFLGSEIHQYSRLALELIIKGYHRNTDKFENLEIKMKFFFIHNHDQNSSTYKFSIDDNLWINHSLFLNGRENNCSENNRSRRQQ